MYDRASLTNPLDDFSRSVAAFAWLVSRLAGRLVELLAGSVALGADIFAGAGRSDLRIIVGGVVSRWILGLHGLRPVVKEWRSTIFKRLSAKP